MKTFLFWILLVSFLINGNAQNHEILNRFQAIKDKDRVILLWTIKQNSSCQGIGILRSTNNRDFVQIGKIEGVCGSPSEEQHFTYVDENPVPNKTNYYVLELGFSGQTIPSLKVEFIDLSTSSSIVIPNPALYSTTIHFHNPNNEKHELFIYDLTGKYVWKGTTHSDSYHFDIMHIEDLSTASFNIPRNMYHYIIRTESGKKISSGKIFFRK